MEERSSPFAILGPVIGALILYLVLSTAMNQFNRDSEQLREEFVVEPIDGAEETEADGNGEIVSEESSEAEEESETVDSEE